jgi:hypothetical protein
MNSSDINAQTMTEELRALQNEVEGIRRALGGSVIDAVADWLSPVYLQAARTRLDTAEPDQRWEVLRAFVQDWAMLRRGDHSAARLQLERERWEWLRSQAQAAKEREFREWLERPEIRAELFPERQGGLSAETLRKVETMLKLM